MAAEAARLADAAESEPNGGYPEAAASPAGSRAETELPTTEQALAPAEPPSVEPPAALPANAEAEPPAEPTPESVRTESPDSAPVPDSAAPRSHDTGIEYPEPAQPLAIHPPGLSEAAGFFDPAPAGDLANAGLWPSEPQPIAAEPEPNPELGEAFIARDPAEPGDENGADSIAESPPDLPQPEIVGGDIVEEARERRAPPRFLRNYKIQEVIKRRQILLVQVVKEERGSKGAALTTYISLAGRYCVLMPNSPRGGGISRKITSPADRKRLKEVTAEMDLPAGMGLIVRTAGANRPKPEIKRDCEYLMRLWDEIRERTLQSVAPALIYEEANLIKRAIRDVYSRDIDEVLVDGEEGWRAARNFMSILIPSHARKVQLWRDGNQPLFSKFQIDAQLDAMMSPTVQLRSGGYLVINQAEALVAIDVNSGRSTRERNIEETALRTNLEAADEIARQLRLRDLAGLIVIDFIDMESRKHNSMVERRLKEALKLDRARIQVGHISHFGLLEMSRQRLRPSLAETSFILCPHCGGTGHVRSTESAAVHVLREIEEEGARRRASEIIVHLASSIALYLLNHKRARLRAIETRYGLSVTFSADDRLLPPEIRIDRLRPAVPIEARPLVTPDATPLAPLVTEDESDFDPEAEAEAEAEEELAEDEELEPAESAGEEGAGARDEGGPRRRRRRRRRGLRREALEPGPIASAPAEPGSGPPPGEGQHIEGVPEHSEALASAEDEGSASSAEKAASEEGAVEDTLEESGLGENGARGRRRGRRGGRRRRREDVEETLPAIAALDAEQPELPAYIGPTPANPFGFHAYDIFEVIEERELGSQPEPKPPATPTSEAREPVRTPEPPPPEHEPEISVAEPLASSEQGPAPSQEPAGQPVEPAASPEWQEPASAAPEAPAHQPQSAVLAPEEPPTEPEKPPEPLQGPAIEPIIIGADITPGAEKKRGWWRR
ncbi:MAG: Rne/Rng family ribonuclease [Acetobacteraceae bacterium]|nr:Rne/Rng family ribonuclease [Acetobacteraceae bacterium]